MRAPVTTMGSKLAAFSGESVAGGGSSASAADTVNPVIAPASSTVAIKRVGLLQNPGEMCVVAPSTWRWLSILLPLIVIAMSDAPCSPRWGISIHIMGVNTHIRAHHSFQEAVRKQMATSPAYTVADAIDGRIR